MVHQLAQLSKSFGGIGTRTAGMAGELRYPGKVVIVTGGTRGIGEACVREFVCQGSKVVFCAPACERERGEALQAELEASGSPGEACFVVCDVSSEPDIKNLVSVTINQYGCLHCLVNNAGVLPPLQEIDDVTTEDFRCVMDINVVGCFLAAKYSLPYLRRTKGNIINISDNVAFIGYRFSVAYVASKGALIAMTKAMALDEIRYGVRVNSISPGNIWTPMWQRLADESPDPQAKILEGTNEQPIGRFGCSAEIAKAVLFMACEATFCVGCDLLESGGAELGFADKNQQDDLRGTKGIQGSKGVKG